MRMSLLACAALSLCLACTTTSPNRVADEAAIRATADLFIRGIETFDADLAASAFSGDATIFQPIGAPSRYTGIDAIRASFHERFDANRAAGRTQEITPRREKLQLHGDVAVLTFELGDLPADPAAPGWLSRRTLVLHRFPDGWRIVHLHGSNAEVNAPQ
jgi:ketosteroid isomerase-like protein